MAKVEANKRTNNRRAEFVQIYKEDKAFNDIPNHDNTEEDDSNYESENRGEPWKNYEDELYITDKELEIVLQKKINEYTVWDFSYLKTWFDQEKIVFSLYCPCGKIHKRWLEKKDTFVLNVSTT